MSEAVQQTSVDEDDGRTLEVSLDEDWSGRVDRAAAELDIETREEFVQEATRRLVGEVLDDDGLLECPHDDCNRTFATQRERRGHLGSSEHAVDVPDGEFWCGYCGFGPSKWAGINAHHGQSDHDGDPVRLDEEPDRADLIAPDSVPDHKNEKLLRRLYRQNDGSYTAMCRAHEFDVSPGRVRHYLIEFGIHDVTPHGAAQDEDSPVYRDPDWLEEQYKKAGGNISEMHRQVDVDVPYRTLHKNLKRFDIHDPTESPGRSHGKGGPESSTDDSDDDQDDAGDDTDLEKDVPDGADQDDAEEAYAHEELLAVDRPEDVDDFRDLSTPDWLREGSFYRAVEMSDDVDELVAALGWDEPATVAEIVGLLDVEVDVGDRDE